MEVKIIETLYSSGELKKRFSYLSGIRHGPQIWYFKTGQMWCHYYYKNGLQHGNKKIWFRDGTIYYLSQWKNDRHFGLNITFNYENRDNKNIS
jgi:antitoxin component YwqK of YwqJK toxin-antitoxin module